MNILFIIYNSVLCLLILKNNLKTHNSSNRGFKAFEEFKVSVISILFEWLKLGVDRVFTRLVQLDSSLKPSQVLARLDPLESLKCHGSIGSTHHYLNSKLEDFLSQLRKPP